MNITYALIYKSYDNYPEFKSFGVRYFDNEADAVVFLREKENYLNESPCFDVEVIYTTEYVKIWGNFEDYDWKNVQE